jgi:hypothetical protein
MRNTAFKPDPYGWIRAQNIVAGCVMSIRFGRLRCGLDLTSFSFMVDDPTSQYQSGGNRDQEHKPH